jgi:hypothetical protein
MPATYTGQNALDSCRRRLQDFTDESFNDTELLLYLNEAQKDFAQTGCIQAKISASLVAVSSVTHAAIIADTGGSGLGGITEILRCDVGDKPLLMTPIYEELAWPVSGNTSDPTRWTQWNETVLLDSTFTGTLYLYITAFQSDAVVGTTLKTPNQWFHFIVSWMCYRALAANQDPQSALFMGEYNTGKQQAAYHYERREDTPRTPMGE